MRKIVLSLMYVCLACFVCQAQGIKFETGTWEEVLAKAKSENKVIFVDIYTKWCGPCKMVAARVFPDEKVGEYYNANFLNIQIDAESPAGKEFVKKYPVAAYPTFFYINGTGDIVLRSGGGMSPEMFLAEGKNAQMYAKHGGREKINSEIANGTASKELLKDYYSFCPSQEKPAVLNLYLKKLSAEELLHSDNAQALEDMNFYDAELMNRLVDAIVKVSHNQKFADEKFANEFNHNVTFKIQYKISTFLNESISQGDEAWFNELLALKEKFSHYAGSTLDGDVSLHPGRGLFFATPEYNKLCYWAKNGTNEDGFNEAMTQFMEKLINEHPIDSMLKNYSVTVAQLKAFKTGEIRTNLSFLPVEAQKNLIGQSIIYPSLTEKYILEWAHYFWTLSPSNKKTRELCSSWINYAYGIKPYCVETAISASDLLARIGNFKGAKSVLEQAIACQKEIDTTNPLVYRTLERKLKEVSNNKL